MSEPGPDGKKPARKTVELAQHISSETIQTAHPSLDEAMGETRGNRRVSDSGDNYPLAPSPARQVTQPPNSTNRALHGTFAMNIALAALAVATGITAARILGPSGEGELTAIQTWPLLLGTLAMLGLDTALVYFIARQPEKGKQFTSTATLIGLLSSSVVAAVAWFVLPFLLSAEPPQVVSAARTFLLIGLLYALVGIPHGSLRGAHAFTAWNLFRIIPGLAWLCILIVSWLLGHATAIPLSRWYLGGVLATGLPVFIVVKRKLQGPLKPDVRMAPELLRFGLPSALTSLPQTINLRFDQLLIIAFLPARTLGLYVIAVSWSGAVTPLLSAVGSVLFPHVSAEGDTARRGYLLATALQGGAVVAAATTVPFMLLAPFGLPLVFGSSFAPAIPSALVLVPAGAILAWAGIAEEGLRGLGRPAIVLIAEIVAAAVTIASLPELLHSYGIFGAAIASLLGYSTIAVFTVVAISRSTHQPIRLFIIPTRQAITSMMIPSTFAKRGRHKRQGVK
jgi:O-antigen/teichoic acid export membrane protein